MQIITEKKNCTGCGACYNICPQKCIIMEKDEEGFQYPKIIQEKCLDCGLCKKICSVENCIFVPSKKVPEAYLACAKDRDVRFSGAAGGLFLALAKAFLKENENSMVCGAAFDQNFVVRHVLVSNLTELGMLAKSKYVQSDTNGIYSEIENYLKKGVRILFSGMPCQVHGLLSYLKTQYENLYCVDLVCYGVPSPKIFEKYLDWHRENNGEVAQIISRDKRLEKGYYISGTTVRYKNGDAYFGANPKELYGRLFYGGMILRPSCYSCRFKTINHISDLTLGDCWFSKQFIGVKDLLGFTLVFVHSKEGNELLDMVKDDIEAYRIDSISAIKANGGMLYKSNTSHPRRQEFFTDIAKSNCNFEEIVKKYFPDVREDVFRRIVRRIPPLYRVCRRFLKYREFQNRMKCTIPENARGGMVIKEMKIPSSSQD